LNITRTSEQLDEPKSSLSEFVDLLNISWGQRFFSNLELDITRTSEQFEEQKSSLIEFVDLLNISWGQRFFSNLEH